MAKPSRIAAALQYLQQMRDRAADFGGGVVDTLADRARDVGGLAYEALTSDPNIGRMTTAEFSQAADRPTPRLDAMGRGAVELGRAVLTEPVETGKALVRGEVERFRGATESPRAMGQYAGEFVNPLRLAAALRRGPMQELEGYQGSPHKFEPTPDNPLGELDSSKIGTGEGAQAYGHGHYIAENRNIGETYRKALSEDVISIGDKKIAAKRGVQAVDDPESIAINEIIAAHGGQHADPFQTAIERLGGKYGPRNENDAKAIEIAREWRRKGATVETGGHLYTLDLPDEMIDRMLDYDKPLSEQTQSVRDAFASLGFDVNTIKFKTDDELHKAASKYLRSKEAARLVNSDLNAADDIYAARRVWNAGPQAMREYVNSANGTWLKGVLTGAKGADMSGGVAYQKLADSLGGWGGMVGQGGGQASASRKLAELGIPGIRYRDAGSRGKDGTGTRNFVVFPGEEKKVKILKRD